MIFITQGHENGIGLEVFLKSFLTLSSNTDHCFTLIVNHQTLVNNLNLLKLDYEINSKILKIHNRSLKIIEISDSALSQSTVSLMVGLDELTKTKGMLITLPTSKDQLVIDNKYYLGYTEYLRAHFKQPNLAMFFYSDLMKVLLLTDHIPLQMITTAITEELIINKLNSTLGRFTFESIYFSGINPHAGENGLFGREDEVIIRAKDALQKLYPQVSFSGPFSGDTLHYKINPRENQLLVYAYHDQGLVLFKSQKCLMGINITLGLPFLRLSVDHGTAFDLYGKNQANYLGCFYTLKKALEFYE